MVRKGALEMRRDIPFGYEVVDGHIKIIAEEASTIQKVFNEYLSIKSRRYLVEKFNKEATYHRNGKWTDCNMRGLLTNAKYMGNDTYPRIIASEVFNETQNIIYDTQYISLSQSIIESREKAYLNKIYCKYGNKVFNRRKYKGKYYWKCTGRTKEHKKCDFCEGYVTTTDIEIRGCFVLGVNIFRDKKITKPPKPKNNVKLHGLRKTYQSIIDGEMKLNNEEMMDLMFNLTSAEYEMLENKSDEVIKYHISTVSNVDEYNNELLRNIIKQIFVSRDKIEFIFINSQSIELKR